MGTVGTHAINASLYKKMPFDPIKDFAPLTRVANVPNLLVANPAQPFKTVAELITYARANPGKVNYATAGNGEISHLAGAWLHSLTGTTVTFIPFKGTGPALQELMSGRVDISSGILSAALPLLQSGKVRILAVLGHQRAKQFPDIPTAAEMGVTGYDYTAWMGFLAPPATPPAIVNKLSEAFAQVVKTPEIARVLDGQSATPVGSTPAQFKQLISTEVARWKKVVDDSGITLAE